MGSSKARRICVARLAAIAAALVVAIAFGGCNRSIKPPATSPVSGTVLLRGKPVAGVRVTFHPQASAGRIAFVPVGETNAEGEFRLSTGVPNNGAPQGTYAVTFEKPEIEAARKSNYLETEIDAFQGKYSDPEASSWTVVVERGENNLEPFELE